ncbi:gamma-mobile-trio recombinase GmtY [Vibrio parahaemolyticus]|uniref:gamma-mobile-trio recombinase GmtY n=1 Tax=Vibrio parahaemolyticus TaxID=670 RepID=UPI001A25A422|nr:tyrosine-type recombinase/integrase [Vibrio parahaemolyticus]
MMDRFTVICRDRKVSLDGLRTITLRVISLNGALLETFLHYQLSRKHRGKTWHRENAQAMVLLLNYWQTTQGKFASPRLMFEAYSDAVRYGTILADGSDPTGLRWHPRSAAQANKLIKHITAYSDWLFNDTGEESALLNPLRKATPYEKMLNLAAYHHRKNNSFLKHTFDDSKANKQAEYVRSVGRHKEPQTTEATYTFPKDKTWEVIEEGFTIRGSKTGDPVHKRLDLAKVLAFMLMRFCGLRISESLNVYVCDISVDPVLTNRQLDKKIPLVKVHHPEKGFAPNEWRKKYNKPTATRAEYLKAEYAILPRDDKSSPKCLYTGWKNPVLIKGQFYMVAYFNNAQAAEIFMIYWQLYLKYQAPRNQSHPFAFSNLKNGKPLSYKAMRDGLKRAVEKVGLVSRKSEGTTPHGLRHLFKAELEDLGLDQQSIMTMMHHKSIKSQDPYGHKTHEEIQAAMIEAERKACASTAEKTKLLEMKQEELSPNKARLLALKESA